MYQFFSLLLFVFFLSACGNPQPAPEASETPEDTSTSQDKLTLLDESPSTSPAYVTNVLQADLASPRKEMVTTIKDATITINYGSPSVKGREIWGVLEPYDQVWRTGANEATTFTVDTELEVGDQILPAGTYGLFTIPTSNDWTLIFNSTSDQWGAYEYDESKDVLRVTTTPIMGESHAESMDFIVENDSLLLVWEKLRLPFPLQ